ncbi:MAG: hypothetical protein ABSF32_02520 [Ignavibacteria bacterium]
MPESYKQNKSGVRAIKLLSIISLLLLSVLYLYCNGPFPSQTKSDVPSDHTISKNGVLHKPGETNPQEECTECHGADLRGGVYNDNGVLKACQSCYQCHSSLWKGRGGGDMNFFKR